MHAVRSEYQAGETHIEVLVPKSAADAAALRTLYVLPVEPLDGRRWGDALAEVQKLDLHHRFQLVCVYPTFSDWPWYADHPTDPLLRQETYFLKVVVPFVERSYPVARQAQTRLLVGFSKSGWGAWSLLLRHPDTFGRAAAWDAPLDMAQPNRFGMEKIFATQENFERYQIRRLLEQQAAKFRDGKRLIHLGYGNFRDQHLAIEQRLNDLGVSREFRDGPALPHDWTSGWLPTAVGLLTGEDPAQD